MRVHMCTGWQDGVGLGQKKTRLGATYRGAASPKHTSAVNSFIFVSRFDHFQVFAMLRPLMQRLALFTSFLQNDCISSHTFFHHCIRPSLICVCPSPIFCWATQSHVYVMSVEQHKRDEAEARRKQEDEAKRQLDEVKANRKQEAEVKRKADEAEAKRKQEAEAKRKADEVEAKREQKDEADAFMFRRNLCIFLITIFLAIVTHFSRLPLS